MKVNIQWQDQHGHWKHFQTKHNEADAYRTAKRRAESTKNATASQARAAASWI